MSEMVKKVAKTMAIFTFLKGPWRVLTNKPSAAEQAALAEFRESRQPIDMGVQTSESGSRMTNYLMEVNTGTWVYPALERLNRNGIKFRLGCIAIRELSNYVGRGFSDVPKLINASTFAWANASFAFFLVIEDNKDMSFALESMGLIALDAKKTPKRLQEVMRSCQMHKSGKIEDLSWLMLEDSDIEEIQKIHMQQSQSNWPAIKEEVTLDLDSVKTETVYDGIIAISKTFAVKMCFSMPDGREKSRYIAKINRNKLGRLLFRLTTPYGLVKGLAVICEDNQLKADVVFHKSALKGELFSADNQWHATAFVHPHLHTAMWDMQSMFHNHEWLMTEERFQKDSNAVIEDFKTAIESGELPDFILHQETESHDESGVPMMETAVGNWKKNHKVWQSAGLELDASANFLFMAYGSLKNQMTAARRKNRWWCPMSNAFTATVSTWEALKYLAGFDLPEEKRNVVFYDDRFGAILPGDRFAKTADLHDTWDQDGDQAKFVWVRIWSSDPAKTEALKEDHVIPRDLVVPTTESEAIDMAVVIRSPNGPGGYSIERFDAETMPWLRRCEERIQVIDLRNAPFGMKTLLQTTECGSIPHSVVYSGSPMTREHAERMISAQFINPHVGGYANLIMAYSAIMGASYPEWLPAIGDDVINTNQQEADAEAFAYLNLGIEEMRDNVLEEMLVNEQPIDEFVFSTRLGIGLDKDQQALYERLLHKGKFTRMDDMNKAALAKVNELTMSVSFTRRMQSKTRLFLMEKIPHLKPELAAWASEVHSRYNSRLESADRQYTRTLIAAKSAGFNKKFVKMSAETQRTEMITQIIDDLYEELMTHQSPEKWAVILYRWMVDPVATRRKYGVSDRVIFQSGMEEQLTVMDLLIQGILNLK